MFFLYNSIIGPVELLLEFFFRFVQVITKNSGIAVIALSFIVTLLTLPLYMVAERWQEKERFTQNKMKAGIERIKRTFKGDEQYMILNTFYRQNHYHPIMALRSSFGLLIQIPFFMAAYSFLSNLEVLNGYSFLFIKDLGSPDAALKIGAIAINILPIAMTLINCIAGYIYSKGHGIREQIQIYACALVFLILLYNSPAGLVVYWTMNNILSLVKNIFYKIKNPKKIIYILCCLSAGAAIILIFSLLKQIDKVYKAAFIFMAVILISYPRLIKILSNFLDKNTTSLETTPSTRLSIFIISSLVMATLAGLSIPSILIESQPDLYCYVDNYTSPAFFILITFAKALGLFFLWPLCFYALFSSKIKNVLTFLFFNLAVYSIVNTFCFSGNYGSINPTLLFIEPQTFIPSAATIALNTAVFAFIFISSLVLIRKKMVVMVSSSFILLFALISISAINFSSISKEFKKMEAPSSVAKIEPVYHLSKTGKNVIVFMQDACMTPLIPELFNDIPALKEHFSGFTYYPNTVTLGYVTMIGSPGIFGGYDYTPFEINKREDKTLQHKHNESLLSLPVLFNAEKFNVTVSNLPYENYLEEPVTSMYKGYEFIKRINTTGKYSRIWYNRHKLAPNPHTSFLIKRNFICFSIFKMVPPVLRSVIYAREYWIANNPYENSADFANHYSVLEFLPELMDSKSETNSFIMIDNEATHESDFASNEIIPSNGKSVYSDDSVFKVHAAVFLKYAAFFDYLKENGLYDNTRIIIVSDHGGHLHNKSISKNVFGIPDPKLAATLLIKDFNSRQPLVTNNTFMTNADVPYLATNGIISDAKNPFTGNSLKVQNKQYYIKIAIPNSESTRIRHNTKFKINPENWYTVHNDIYNIKNWVHFYGEESNTNRGK